MTSQEARDIAEILAAELLPLVELAKKSDRLPVHQRDLLVRMGQRLQRTCKMFEVCDGCELYEATYLTLFDTLAFVTDAIAFPSVLHDRLGRVEAALTQLRQPK